MWIIIHVAREYLAVDGLQSNAMTKLIDLFGYTQFRYWEKPSPLPPGWEVRRDQRGRVYYVGKYQHEICYK